jgi:hypothetical protein
LDTPGGRFHWPERSGYFDSSNARAPVTVANRAAKSASALIDAWHGMNVLPDHDGQARLLLLADVVACVSGRRKACGHPGQKNNTASPPAPRSVGSRRGRDEP